ncbi:MAG: acyltransferase family protein [Bacteroidales bacterium]
MNDNSQTSGQGRLIALDAFRGFTIAAMIMVNYPGSWNYVYSPLLHVDWHGITPTDLIFPFFIFIVGVSIVLAYSKRLEAGLPKKNMYKKIAVRSIKIFAVGIFLNLYPNFDLESIRIAGVLQRIAIVFGVCALIYLNSGWKAQAWSAALILVFYWISMTVIPVPGLGTPMLEPGMNLAAWIDQQILPGRMWQGTWDPEGLYSTLPAIVTGITGMLAGKLIISGKSQEYIVIWLFSLGFISTVSGEAWSWIFPINKNIWTSSYVLYTSGLAAMTLATAMFFIDILGYRKGTKFGVIYGANAITAYVLAGILSVVFYGVPLWGRSLNSHFVSGLSAVGFEPKLASLAYALIYVFIIFIPVYYLYKKKIFIKL